MAPIVTASFNNSVLYSPTIFDPKFVYSNGPTIWILHYLRNWQPFRLDALGIVTLLGADEVNTSIGTLVRNRVFEYMPLLGAFVISSDAFRKKQPGYKLYNINEAIETTELAAWFTRWLQLEDFPRSCSEMKWEIIPKKDVKKPLRRILQRSHIFALSGAMTIQLWFICFTLLLSDWWGLANAISMIISVLVRWYIIKKNRDWLDDAVDRGESQDTTDITAIIITSDSRMITMKAPGGLMTQCFTTDLQPSQEPRNTDEPSRADVMYEIARWIGWLAYGAHVVTIGQSVLVTQIITVVLIVVPTLGVCLDPSRKHTCNSKKIGSRLRVTVDRWETGADEQRRSDAYARLNLDPAEERLIKKWDLTPEDSSNVDWWRQYEEKKQWYISNDENERKKQVRERRNPAALRKQRAAVRLQVTPQGVGLATLQNIFSNGPQLHNEHVTQPRTN